jgi:hypothetical protein
VGQDPRLLWMDYNFILGDWWRRITCPRTAPWGQVEAALRRCFGQIHSPLGLFRRRTPVSEDLRLLLA